jgi:hypothetical protein
MTAVDDQTNRCLGRIQGFVSAGGTGHGEAAVAAVSEIISWLSYFESSTVDAHAAELLSGARASVIEAVAYVSLGLGRAAITAIRGQIDLLIGYTYFHDHPAEWEMVERTGDGFKLRSAIYRYHEETTPGFKLRLGLIQENARFDLSKLYQILSAHIHGQTTLTIPQSNSLDEVVSPTAFVASIVELQKETAIALSNFLAAVHAPHWPELPEEIVRRVKNSLSSQQRPKFFAD